MLAKKLRQLIQAKTRQAIATAGVTALIPRTLTCRLFKNVRERGVLKLKDVHAEDLVSKDIEYIIRVRYKLEQYISNAEECGYEIRYKPTYSDLNTPYMHLFAMILIEVGQSLLQDEFNSFRI